MSGLSRVMAWRPSLHPHYRASFHAIGLHASTVLFRHPTSQSRLHPSPFRLVRAYSNRRDWHSRRTRTAGISLVASWASCVARSWPSTPGLQSPLAKNKRGAQYCLQLVRQLGQYPRKHAFRGSIPFTVWAASPLHSSSLPFCVRFNEPVTSLAATLDTGPLARSYPGGRLTHLSMKHFQFAPDPHARWCGRGPQQCGPYPDRGTPGMGVIVMGCKSPVQDWESRRSSVYQMTAPIDKVRGEGNCGRVTDRGEEAPRLPATRDIGGRDMSVKPISLVSAVGSSLATRCRSSIDASPDPTPTALRPSFRD